MQFSIDMPYPTIKVEKKDVDLAKEIFNLYAGSISEDTAIHSYIFQMLIFHDNKELKEIFKGISITEMHHLEILGLLIKELGLNPIFVGIKDKKATWFSGEYAVYEKDLKKILEEDIKREKIAIENYEKVINKTVDKHVIHILKRIILDERLHIKILSQLYQQL